MDFVSHFDEGNFERALNEMNTTDFIGHNFQLNSDMESASSLLGNQSENLTILHYTLLNLDASEDLAINDAKRSIVLQLIDQLSIEMLQSRSENGNTPVHVAAYLGEVEILEKLLLKGASPHIENNMGLRAVDMTSKQETLQVLKTYQTKTQKHKRNRSLVSSRSSSKSPVRSLAKNLKLDSKASMTSMNSMKDFDEKPYVPLVRKSSQEKMLEKGTVRNNPFLQGQSSIKPSFSKAFLRLQSQVEDDLDDMINTAVSNAPDEPVIVKSNAIPHYQMNILKSVPKSTAKEQEKPKELSAKTSKVVSAIEKVTIKEKPHIVPLQNATKKADLLDSNDKTNAIQLPLKIEEPIRAIPKEEEVEIKITKKDVKDYRDVKSIVSKFNVDQSYVPRPYTTYKPSDKKDLQLKKDTPIKITTLQDRFDPVSLQDTPVDIKKDTQCLSDSPSIKDNAIEIEQTNEAQESQEDHKVDAIEESIKQSIDLPEVATIEPFEFEDLTTESFQLNQLAVELPLLDVDIPKSELEHVEDTPQYFDISNVTMKKKNRKKITNVFEPEEDNVLAKLRHITTSSHSELPSLSTLSIPKMDLDLELDINNTINSLSSFQLPTSNRYDKSSDSDYGSRPYSRGQSVISIDNKSERSSKQSEKYSNLSARVFVSPGQLINPVEAIEGSNNLPKKNENKVFFVYINEIKGFQPKMLPTIKAVESIKENKRTTKTYQGDKIPFKVYTKEDKIDISYNREIRVEINDVSKVSLIVMLGIYPQEKKKLVNFLTLGRTAKSYEKQEYKLGQCVVNMEQFVTEKPQSILAVFQLIGSMNLRVSTQCYTSAIE